MIEKICMIMVAILLFQSMIIFTFFAYGAFEDTELGKMFVEWVKKRRKEE